MQENIWICLSINQIIDKYIYLFHIIFLICSFNIVRINTDIFIEAMSLRRKRGDFCFVKMANGVTLTQVRVHRTFLQNFPEFNFTKK